MLVIAPHPDDEVLGAGGLMTRFALAGGKVTVLTVAAHMPPLFPKSVHNQTISEAKKAHAIMGVNESIFLNKPAVGLRDEDTATINNDILTVVKNTNPDIVLIPYFDRHIDHRVIFDACMVATRPVGAGLKIKVLAAYETLSETHWNAPHIEPNFTPNWVVDITDQIEVKLNAFSLYESQVHSFPAPRSIEALRALALFRGSQSGYGYGEAFHIIRMTAPPESFF